MKKKVVNPLLPEPYCRMTAEELDAEVAEFDQPISLHDLKPLTPAMKARLRRAQRKAGRPRVGKGAQRVLVTIERDLLRKADQFAQHNGMNRSQLIAKGLVAMMDRRQVA